MQVLYNKPIFYLFDFWGFNPRINQKLVKLKQSIEKHFSLPYFQLKFIFLTQKNVLQGALEEDLKSAPGHQFDYYFCDIKKGTHFTT